MILSTMQNKHLKVSTKRNFLNLDLTILKEPQRFINKKYNLINSFFLKLILPIQFILI